MYFDIRAGWLHYHPFDRFTLPTLQHCYNTNAAGHEAGPPKQVEFIHPEDAHPMYTRPLFRLEWPGTMYIKEGSTDWGDGIPCQILKHWPNVLEILEVDGSASSHYSLRTLIQARVLPKELPIPVAYHYAVNSKLYDSLAAMKMDMVPPVGAIPGPYLDPVTQNRFALDGRAQAALTYLKWVAETHFNHPLLTGFDTVINDDLQGIARAATRLFFELLGDYQYDMQTQWWSRSDDRKHWAQLASYLFWCGRAPYALTEEFANWDPEFFRHMPACLARLKEFRGHGFNRAMAHVTGEDPAVTVGKEIDALVETLIDRD